MKAILVIDMPESCEECPFCDDFYYCIPEKAKGYVAFVEKSGRQEWCPLKPMPQTRDVGYPINNYAVGFSDGWDAFKKEITE